MRNAPKGFGAIRLASAVVTSATPVVASTLGTITIPLSGVRPVLVTISGEASHPTSASECGIYITRGPTVLVQSTVYLSRGTVPTLFTFQRILMPGAGEVAQGMTTVIFQGYTNLNTGSTTFSTSTSMAVYEL